MMCPVNMFIYRKCRLKSWCFDNGMFACWIRDEVVIRGKGIHYTVCLLVRTFVKLKLLEESSCYFFQMYNCVLLVVLLLLYRLFNRGDHEHDLEAFFLRFSGNDPAGSRADACQQAAKSVFSSTVHRPEEIKSREFVVISYYFDRAKQAGLVRKYGF